MSATIATTEAAFKTVYLDVLRPQINTQTTAVYNKIKTSNRNIVGGNQVVKLAPFGVNGGFGAGSEVSALPVAGANQYAQFKSWIKCMYGVIEVSDLAAEASKSDVGAFVNMIKANMNGLQDHAKMSYGRQIYLDGSGKLTLTGTTNPAATTINVASTQYLTEGMTIDILDNTGAAVANGTQRRITSVDRTNKTITLSGTATVATANTGFITEQGSYNLEITGMEQVFKSTGNLYELARETYSWLIPQLFTDVGAISDKAIMKAIMQASDYAGGKIDLLAAAGDVYLEYGDYLEATKRNVNTQTLEGGFIAISCAGVPMTADKNIKSGKLELLDTTQWTFHQLADWDWMQDQNGSILKQVAGYPKWTATLRKYGEVICDHPAAQAEMSGITVS
jgi:hypothetical protein